MREFPWRTYNEEHFIMIITFLINYNKKDYCFFNDLLFTGQTHYLSQMDRNTISQEYNIDIGVQFHRSAILHTDIVTSYNTFWGSTHLHHM